MKLAMLLVLALPACAVDVTTPAPTMPDLGGSAGAFESACHVVCGNIGFHCALACPGEESDVADPNNAPVDVDGDPPQTPSTTGSVDPLPTSGGGVPCGNP